ncbi:MAG: hypothetical protein HY586_06890 [Candidatus Omnitrophica bacterium]|nr:hypothetical protein [Candidatus Omnitrophota bacterium]
MKKMKKLVRLTTNNQVAIPTLICRDMGLEKGAYLQVEEKGAQIVMTPMRLVDSEEAFYLEKARQGHKEFERGETVSWESVKKKLEKMRRSRKK